MEKSKIVLIKNFTNHSVNKDFDKNWSDIMDVSECIIKMGSFASADITSHEMKLLNDLRAHVRNSILMFDKSKTVSCIIDFISTYNIVFENE